MSTISDEETPTIPVVCVPVSVPSGVRGFVLVHFPVWTEDDMLPFDGEWSVTIEEHNIGTQRCRFRTLHAATHYLYRIKDLTDWSLPFADLNAVLKSDPALRSALLHAEAHAHEVDASWPSMAWIPMGNGPAILDDTGNLHKFWGQAPDLKWDGEGDDLRCSVCGAEPKVRFES